MYYYHSLSYKTAEKNPICFIELDNGIEHDPYLCWKLNRPPSTKRANIMFLSPIKFSICRALFSILTHFAREFYAKASILIDYEHYDCTLQLSCLDCLDLYGIDKELLLYVIFHTQNIRFDSTGNNKFAITMEFPLFNKL